MCGRSRRGPELHCRREEGSQPPGQGLPAPSPLPCPSRSWESAPPGPARFSLYGSASAGPPEPPRHCPPGQPARAARALRCPRHCFANTIALQTVRLLRASAYLLISDVGHLKLHLVSPDNGNFLLPHPLPSPPPPSLQVTEHAVALSPGVSAGFSLPLKGRQTALSLFSFSLSINVFDPDD